MIFSIILPVYNASSHLRECLDSLCSQKITDWECICVDDGSIDDSLVILEEYKSRDPRFKIVQMMKNVGVSCARNFALEKVTGDYVCFVDADDVVSADWLLSVADAFAATCADMVKTQVKRGECKFGEYKNQVASYPVFERGKTWELSFLRGGLTVQNFYKRRILQNVRFPVGMKVFEDGIFNLYALVNTEKVTIIEYAGYWYRVSETSAFTRRNVEDVLRLTEELERWYDNAKEAISRYAVDLLVKQRISTYINSVLTSLLLKPGILRTPLLKDRLPCALAHFEQNLSLRLDEAFAMGRGRWLKRFAYRQYLDNGWIWPFLVLLNLMFWNKKS